MKSIADIIRKRRSIYPHQYNDEQVTKEEIQELLKVANWAPTHRKTEPWRFKVLQGKSKTKFSAFVGSLYFKSTDKPSKFKQRKIIDKFQKSSAVIAICLQRDPKESVPEWEEVAAVAMSVQNMWILATEMQIGCYWSSPKMIKDFGEFFDFKEGEKCLGLLYLGKTDEEWPKGERQTSIDEKLDFFD